MCAVLLFRFTAVLIFVFIFIFVFFRTTLGESLAAMKTLLTIKGEGDGEVEEEGEIEGEGEEEGEGEGRERLIEVNEERNEDDNEDRDDDENNNDEEVEQNVENKFDGVAERGLHPINTDSRYKNDSDKKLSDILLEPIGVGKLTHHNLRNLPGHVPVHVRACKKKEGIDGLELNIESTQIKDNNKNENKDANENVNGSEDGIQCRDRNEDHISILITTTSRNKSKFYTTSNNITKRHNNPTIIIYDKSLISLSNDIKFKECSFYLKACSESMTKLKALIEKDVLNLSLVVHEPEIWRRYISLSYTLFYNVLSYIILYHIISYYIMLYHIILCYIILYCIILYYIMLYYIMLYYIILYYVILYHVILYYIILYYIILCYII